jgi:hypothetical protein
VVKRVRRSSKAARGEDVQGEPPVWGGDAPAFHVHATLAGMRSPTRRGDQGIEVRQPGQKRLWAATRRLAAFHRAQLPLAGVLGLSSHRAGHRPLGGCEDGIPARLLCLAPASDARAVGFSGAVGHAVGTVAEPLPQRTPPSALALTRPVQAGMARGAYSLTHRGRERGQLWGELVERVAEPVAEACSRAHRPPPVRWAGKASGQEAADPRRRLLLERRLLKRSVRLGQRRRTGRFGGAQVPQDTPPDHGGPIDRARETAAVLRIRQAIHRQRQPTPGEHRDQSGVAERTDETRQRPGRERLEHRTPRHAQAARRGQQHSAGPLRAHAAIASDEVREARDHRLTGRAWAAPESDPAQTDADRMGVTRQAPAAITEGRVLALATAGQKAGEDPLEKRLPIAQQLKGRGCIAKSDGHGAVFSSLFGRLPPVSPPVLRSCERTRNNGEKFLQYQEECERTPA